MRCSLLGREILSAHRRLVLFKGNELLIVIRAEALRAGEHVYRFEKRRFSLRVRARDDVHARRKFDPAARQQTEIFRLHRIDAHQPSARRRTGQDHVKEAVAAVLRRDDAGALPFTMLMRSVSAAQP